MARFRPGRSARIRLTLAFAAVVTVVGGSIVASVYLVMRFLPSYHITSARQAESEYVEGQESVEAGSGHAVIAPSLVPSAEGPSGVSAAEGGVGIVALQSADDILRLLLTASLIVFAVVLVAGVVISWIVAGRVLRPVEQITAAARDAASGRLDHRIAHTGPPDEFGRLADTFDDMLERLQRSFEAQRRFASNASHELRTPLATTQALLDVALLDPDDFDRETLTTKLRETNTRNIETVEALLAFSDAQAGTTATDRVELDDVAREVMATCQADAAERDIVIHSTIAASTIRGDATLVRLLVSNLVSNAIRYNLTGGDVWLMVSDQSVRVENTGVVIADHVLPRLTEPFFRAAGRVTNSHGLGLALVDAIASGHGAALELAARRTGGLVVEVTFTK
ncbi:HAMP domain-containing sensor histidine kinase [Frondihabitans sp. PAMC 28766]|uniref:sensor histidine kinase n=1 Tax=Frondihabitans sp. PAMC 28766 TaxID=1795630 RepID=UPI0012FF9501|nr:HAMP domain-containing sensor histidine kinase [Frondihabitans sp. PAMC 28766]